MSNGNAKQQFQQAGQLYQAKRYAEALKILDDLARDMPGNTEVLYARAMCLAAAGHTAAAVELCKMLSRVYGDPRGNQLRAQLMQRAQPAAPAPKRQTTPAPASAPAAPRAKATLARKRKAVPVVLAILVLALAAGGAYYYVAFMAAGAPTRTATRPSAVDGVFGDPQGVKIATRNETDGVLDVWIGDVGATTVPLASFEAGASGTIGLAPGKQPIRARARWYTMRYHTAIGEIEISDPGQLVFYREYNAIGVPEVKWRLE
ncbi:MAG TPA: tetratricopeptide repeat protein [Candidatus Hydrogenedentes bacterium]|nr:tetratricopeptide repeat protein [Candidatus Hydrogenedentota bacterium]